VVVQAASETPLVEMVVLAAVVALGVFLITLEAPLRLQQPHILLLLVVVVQV
jgi:hypothetical protein